MNPPRSVGVQYATREEQKHTSKKKKKNKEVKPKYNMPVSVCLVVKAKSNAIKSNIA